MSPSALLRDATASDANQKPIKRTKSSLLAFKLREFLDSRDAPAFEPALPSIAETSPVIPRRAASRPPVHRPAEDTVWVDCFYYGFYIEKSRLPAFQASLRQQQAMHQQHQITPAVKAM